MNKKWEFFSHNQVKVQEITEKFGISELLATVLVNRNIVGEKEVELFLNPTRNDFHDPYLMPDMRQAVDRIVKAIENKEKTMIYGDYDVDGITSITVLSRFFKERGLEVGAYIPNRLDEGYGLNKEAIKQIADEGYKLIITVDCGISGTEEVAYAYELGMEVIITDHHEPLEVLPNAYAVIDPKREDSQYPFRHLAGVGVVFKLIQALSIHLKLDAKEYLNYDLKPQLKILGPKYGSKIGALLIVVIPLFGLIPCRTDEEIHSEDSMERAELQEKIDKRAEEIQLYVALFCSMVACLVMLGGLFLC